MANNESDGGTTHCPNCGGRPAASFATGMRACEDCDTKWDKETGETLEGVVSEEARLLFGGE